LPAVLGVSAIAQLRAATWQAHQSLEKRLDIKTLFASPSGYRRYIEKMWGFCASLEERLDWSLLRDALADHESRRKLPLLTRDLMALGADGATLTRLPRCQSVPVCSDAASALGCLYVMEGASLGGRTLLPIAERRLGLSSQRGAAFLASYGEAVAAMWRSFGQALDHWCTVPERCTCASISAVATFGALEEWLCGCPA
jgi:heme oxygenase